MVAELTECGESGGDFLGGGDAQECVSSLERTEITPDSAGGFGGGPALD